MASQAYYSPSPKGSEFGGLPGTDLYSEVQIKQSLMLETPVNQCFWATSVQVYLRSLNIDFQSLRKSFFQYSAPITVTKLPLLDVMFESQEMLSATSYSDWSQEVYKLIVTQAHWREEPTKTSVLSTWLLLSLYLMGWVQYLQFTPDDCSYLSFRISQKLYFTCDYGTFHPFPKWISWMISIETFVES